MQAMVSDCRRRNNMYHYIRVLLFAGSLLLPHCGGLPAVPSAMPNPGRPPAPETGNCVRKAKSAWGISLLRRGEQLHRAGLAGLVRVRGGMEDVEASGAVSTMAIPGMGVSHAFAPLAARKDQSGHKPEELVRDPSVSNIWAGARDAQDVARALASDDLDDESWSQPRRRGRDYAWFYPDAPWGRKDVLRPGSRFLMFWDFVLWIAMLYVGFHVPFHAAGFVSEDWVDDEHCVSVNAQGKGGVFGVLLKAHDHPLDIFVDGIFLSDMWVSLHTAFYKNAGNGHRVLVEDLASIRSHYLASREFVCDMCGVLPLRMSVCLVTSMLPDHLRPQMAKFVNLVRLSRMAKLLRLHRLNRISNFIKYTFPGKRRIFELATLLLKMLFTGHLLACVWYL